MSVRTKGSIRMQQKGGSSVGIEGSLCGRELHGRIFGEKPRLAHAFITALHADTLFNAKM
eukprot:1157822-Pelagomonas_calceolata.AAC.12